MSKQVIADHLEPTRRTRHGKGTIRFAYDEKLPVDAREEDRQGAAGGGRGARTPLTQLVAASASWPHAASIERPRVSRTVTFAPSFSSVCTNRLMRAGGEPSTG